MNPKIVKFGPVKVAGLEHICSQKTNTIPAFWDSIFADGRHGKLHSESFAANHMEYGVCIDEGESIRYIIGLEVKADAAIPDEYSCCEIVKSDYAVVHMPPGSMENIGSTWDATTKWVQNSNEFNLNANAISFELYQMDCTCEEDGKGGYIECEACKAGPSCDIYVAVIGKEEKNGKVT